MLLTCWSKSVECRWRSATYQSWVFLRRGSQQTHYHQLLTRPSRWTLDEKLGLTLCVCAKALVRDIWMTISCLKKTNWFRGIAMFLRLSQFETSEAIKVCRMQMMPWNNNSKFFEEKKKLTLDSLPVLLYFIRPSKANVGWVHQGHHGIAKSSTLDHPVWSDTAR